MIGFPGGESDTAGAEQGLAKDINFYNNFDFIDSLIICRFIKST